MVFCRYFSVDQPVVNPNGMDWNDFRVLSNHIPIDLLIGNMIGIIICNIIPYLLRIIFMKYHLSIYIPVLYLSGPFTDEFSRMTR